ncbi:chemotaxis protein [Azospirillum baldaniorum]|uniref:PAS domain-containing protein n=1 Tax=Azospirillum baldaniorum TaxID=1064539 RepID=A0A9P1JPV0_9PROT|nr:MULTISPECIES: PAS domain-containing protein [Azospirillum]AWJ90418.1 chemotaxis protein [Azospirillum baldaniorum]MBK3733743.1 PAS domain-containing protein [Azospirillum brasilense]NUB23366.1 PAS domain-containing protein [Azospirillum brasilense]NUB30988.1 PAS domain-containing protein [Azospirillum brasilense]RIW05631.1 PAS domain S-box protein [Azospirillum brasilense]
MAHSDVLSPGPRDRTLTGVERFFDADEVIVSKTDLKGRITYANRVFQRVAGYSEAELMGAPHSIVRHPDMPRCVFKLLWDTLGAGQEIFAYVVNRARNGDHYWVFAHVTPSYDVNGRLVGYHSSRRVPDRGAIDKVVPLYRTLLDIENRHEDRKQGMNEAFATVVGLLTEKGIGYDEFVFSL